MTEFNINNKVAVKLTPIGRDLHKKNWLDEQAHIWGAGGSGFEYRAPVEDDDGWSEWQMGDLMREFGKHCYNGCKVPFETTIRILG